MEERQNPNLRGIRRNSDKIEVIYTKEKIKNVGDEIKLTVQ